MSKKPEKRASIARGKQRRRRLPAQPPSAEKADSDVTRRDLERLLYEAARMRANRAAAT